MGTPIQTKGRAGPSCNERVVKFYNEHAIFSKYMLYPSNSTDRAAELKSLSGRKYLDALCVYFWATTPVLISILTFTTYAALGHQLTAAKVCIYMVYGAIS